MINSLGYSTNKTCSSEHPCQHRTYGNGFWGCGYGGYCDFQRPRDSRMQPLYPPTWDLSAKQHDTFEGTCPYCHKPYHLCTGHTICEEKKNESNE